ncbi:MAG: cytosolic protein, partial [Actinobacteria bacterium]|nr:cytosolic protein [Actinomycetota bacterium]
QRFWEFISSSENLYTKIIQPLGNNAKKRNDEFYESYAQILNKFTIEFGNKFCDNGNINWEKLVEFNSSKISPSHNAIQI